MRKREREILYVVLIIIVFMLLISLYTLFYKVPAIVVSLENDDITVKKLGLVNFMEPANVYCEGFFVEAKIITPSNKHVVCSKNCVLPIGNTRIYCDKIEEEDGNYSITINVFDDENLAKTKDFEIQWSK